MKNLNEVVDLLIKELFHFKGMSRSKEKVFHLLMQKGIEPEEINKALQFIIKKIKKEQFKELKDKKFRILTELEMSRMTDEAYQRLSLYYDRNFITWKQIEEILFKIENMPNIIGVPELDSLMEKYFFMRETNIGENQTFALH